MRLCDFVIDYVGFPTRQRGLKGLFDYRRGLPPPPVVEDPTGAPASLHQGTNKTLYGSCCCVNAVGTALLCRPPRLKVMSFAAEIIENLRPLGGNLTESYSKSHSGMRK